MSTLTAIHPRIKNTVSETVNIPLVLAKPEDLKEFYRYGPGGVKQFKLRVGMVYWLKSHLKNEIEPTPRQIKQDEDQHQIIEWLKLDMIFVCKAWYSL